MAHDLLGSVKSIDHLKLFNQTWFSYRVLFDTFDTEERASFSFHMCEQGACCRPSWTVPCMWTDLMHLSKVKINDFCLLMFYKRLIFTL